MQPLMEVQQGTLMQSGIYPSLAPNQQALWRDASNVLFVDGRVEKLRGWQVQTTAVASINALAQSFADSERRVYYGTANALFVWRSGVITRLGAGFGAGRWSLEPYGTWLLATNYVDPPQIWKNGIADTAAALGGIAAKGITRAKIIKKLANFIIVYATNISAQRIDWSDQSAPETWLATELNKAGGITMRDLDGDLMAAEHLRDVIAFYTEDSMGVTEFVGGDVVFSNTIKLNGIGAVGINAVTEVNGQHYGVSRKGIWNTDGFSFTYVDDPAVNRWLQDNVDWTKGNEVNVVHHEKRRMVEFFFTCLDGTRRGLGLNYLGKSWTHLDANVTAIIEQQVYDDPIVAIGADLSFWDKGNNAGSAPLPASIRSAFLDGGSRARWKLWDKLTVEFEQQGIMEIRFGFAETPFDDEIEWGDWAALSRENYIGRESPFLVFEIRSNVLASKWTLNGFALFGEPTGYVD